MKTIKVRRILQEPKPIKVKAPEGAQKINILNWEEHDIKERRMKYVRLKRGDIISYDENADDLDKPTILDYPSEIVKESDNLEKLFDEYILENEDHTYQSFLVKADYHDKRSFSDGLTRDVISGWFSYCYKYLINGFTIYGAIIVRGSHDEPILKTVAKMKKEGEWELL